jgi:2-oxoglutarate dehydrogenase E1 component
MEDFTHGKFLEVIDDAAVNPKDIQKLVFCSGKIYYDLVEHREKVKATDTAIIRIEQLYPIPYEQLVSIIAKYSHVKQYVWAQEEPENMGAWSFVNRKFKTPSPLIYVGRDEAASPATGFAKMHNAETYAIMDAVFMPVTKQLYI